MTEVARRTTGGIVVIVYKCDKNRHYIVEKQKQEDLMAKLTPEQTARIYELAKAMDKSFVEVCQMIIVSGLQILEGEQNAEPSKEIQLPVSGYADFQTIGETND
jgi:hypothetical protein